MIRTPEPGGVLENLSISRKAVVPGSACLDLTVMRSRCFRILAAAGTFVLLLNGAGFGQNTTRDTFRPMGVKSATRSHRNEIQERVVPCP